MILMILDSRVQFHFLLLFFLFPMSGLALDLTPLLSLWIYVSLGMDLTDGYSVPSLPSFRY